MRGKIPKTELLVTFEVVARHESYTRAAEELALTQSAVFVRWRNFYILRYFHTLKNAFFLMMQGSITWG